MAYKHEMIWIIGASSGIGYALAQLLAEQGATLILSARREEELKKLQAQLGENHLIYKLDIANPIEIKEVCAKIANLETRLDRVILMSALYKPGKIAMMDLDFMSKMVDVNLKGAIYLTHEIIPIFEKQKSGQLALCGSVAGYTGLPNAQPYSATKAALINFTESLAIETPDYIDIKLISPGFVKTPMTDKNDFTMPMIITPKQAALAIVNGLHKKAFEIHFPKKFTYFLKLISILPYPLKQWINKRIS